MYPRYCKAIRRVHFILGTYDKADKSMTVKIIKEYVCFIKS